MNYLPVDKGGDASRLSSGSERCRFEEGVADDADSTREIPCISNVSSTAAGPSSYCWGFILASGGYPSLGKARCYTVNNPGGGSGPPSGAERSGHGGAFVDDPSCTRTILGVFIVPRRLVSVTVVLNRCGSLAAIMTAILLVTTTSFQAKKPTAVVAALPQAETVPEPEGTFEAEASLPRDAFPETDLATMVASPLREDVLREDVLRYRRNRVDAGPGLLIMSDTSDYSMATGIFLRRVADLSWCPSTKLVFLSWDTRSNVSGGGIWR